MSNQNLSVQKIWSVEPKKKGDGVLIVSFV